MSVYRAHCDFVFRSLDRLGVQRQDLEDQLQEVFIIVQRKLPTYNTTLPIAPWLFGITMRVAIAYHRKVHRKREHPSDQIVYIADNQSEGSTQLQLSPEDRVSQRQEQQLLHQILQRLDWEKRAVFMMFEVDGLSCEEIASLMDVPVGTVYSRLHHARKLFATYLEQSGFVKRRSHG